MNRKERIQQIDWHGHYYYPHHPDRTIIEVETNESQVVLHFEDGDRESVSYRQFSYEDLKVATEPTLAATENWRMARESDGDGWRNIETDTDLAVLPSEDGDSWELVTDNHCHGSYGAKIEAKNAALEWMLQNPCPVNI